MSLRRIGNEDGSDSHILFLSKYIIAVGQCQYALRSGGYLG